MAYLLVRQQWNEANLVAGRMSYLLCKTTGNEFVYPRHDVKDDVSRGMTTWKLYFESCATAL